jgi:hypothetical protein
VSGKVVGVDPAVLQRAPRHPQRHPLLRVHRQCFPWRDTEESWVETCGITEESAEIMYRLEPITPRTRYQFGNRPAAIGRKMR